MNTVTNYFSNLIPCSCKDVSEIGGIVVAVGGVAVSILLGEPFAAIGFALFGASIVYYRYFYDAKEVQLLAGQLADSTKKLQAGDAKIASLTKDLLGAANRLQSAQDTAKKQIGELNTASSDLEKSLKRYIKENAGLRQGNQTLIQQNTDLSAHLTQFKTNLGAFQQQVGRFIVQNKDLATKVATFTQSESRLEMTEEHLQKNSEDFGRILGTDLAKLSSLLNSWDSRTEQLSKENEKLAKDLPQLQKELADGDAALKIQEERLNQGLTNLHAEAVRLTNLETTLETSQKELEGAKKAFAAETELLQKQKEGLAKIRTDTESLVANLTHKLAVKTGELKDLKKQLHELEQQITQKKEELAKLATNTVT